MDQFLSPPDVYRGLYGGGLQSASLLETCSSISILQEPKIGAGSARRPDDLDGSVDRSGASRIERQKKIDDIIASTEKIRNVTNDFTQVLNIKKATLEKNRWNLDTNRSQ